MILVENSKNRTEMNMSYPVLTSDNILVITAYSENYRCGRICTKVNKAYCNDHKLHFISRELSFSEMSSAVKPKRHLTWYKIKF